MDLTSVFWSNPWVALKKMRPDNLRRLISACSRYEQATVLAVVKNNVRRSRDLSRIKHASESSVAGLRRAKDLEASYPGITEPVGLGMIPILEEKMSLPAYEIDPTAPARVNVLLPQLDPLIMFGGYISCLQFIRKVQESGFRVRILLCESASFDREAVEAKLRSNPPLRQAVVDSEVENISLRTNSVVISPADAFVCYSVWTGLKAHHLARAVDKEFIFFLQEYESIFHPHDCCYAIAGHVYGLPHRAIFNTSLLADYFRSKGLGVFGLYQGEELEAHQVSYQHALTPASPPSLDQLAQRTTRRLLLYGRPEAHARRNLFEIALLGLRIAIKEGAFDEDWEFFGVGTLGPEYDVDLGFDRTLRLSGTLPQADYGAALREFDVGLSLMLAPHPSILPFEMASAGQIVVTNTFESRTAEVLRGISANIEPCGPDPYSVAMALIKAVGRVSDHAGRIEGASFDWVRNWDDSFNEDTMDRISAILKA